MANNETSMTPYERMMSVAPTWTSAPLPDPLATIPAPRTAVLGYVPPSVDLTGAATNLDSGGYAAPTYYPLEAYLAGANLYISVGTVDGVMPTITVGGSNVPLDDPTTPSIPIPTTPDATHYIWLEGGFEPNSVALGGGSLASFYVMDILGSVTSAEFTLHNAAPNPAADVTLPTIDHSTGSVTAGSFAFLWAVVSVSSGAVTITQPSGIGNAFVGFIQPEAFVCLQR